MLSDRRPRPAGWVVLVLLGLLLPACGSSDSAGEGERPQRSGPVACVGAAARAPMRTCVESALRRDVRPTPAVAARQGNLPCSSIQRTGPISACGFGVDAPEATQTVAIIGDSHAASWRGALEVVAQRRRWRGVSISRSSCPFALGDRPSLSERGRTRCREWTALLPLWFAQRPEISTVFVTANTKTAFRPGSDALAGELRGITAAWRSLPPTVRRIVVIRDVPKVSLQTADCVTRAIARRIPNRRTCLLDRAFALKLDPAVEAARARRDPRARVVDLTDLVCDRRSCFPVVGGVLFSKNPGHMTPQWARSAGPELDRRLEPLLTAPRS